MSDKPVFLYLGQYDDPAAAKDDLEIVRQLHNDGVIGTYDAAVATKEADGKVKIHKHEKPTQHGAWTGVAVGAVVGVIFPPRSSPVPPWAASPAASSGTSGTACRARTSTSSAKCSTPVRRCSSWSATTRSRRRSRRRR